MDEHANGETMAMRLKARARDTGADSRILMIRYAQERLLSRLQDGPDRNRFVLKGGMLFMCGGSDTHRATEDIDLHDTEDLGMASMAEAIRRAASMHADDGLAFDLATFRVARIREGTRPGIRVNMDAAIGRSLVRMKLDLCSGDAITPSPVERELPPALPRLFRPLALLTYPWETVLAEKLHAMIAFGLDSTRMKDWYDVATIAQEEIVDGRIASRAVAATFARRETAVDVDPEALSDAFVRDKSDEFARWVAGVRPPPSRATLPLVVESARDLSLPLLGAAATGDELEADWIPTTGWGGPIPHP